MNNMNKIVSPLTGSQDLKLIDKVKTSKIISDYKKFGIDVSGYFKDLKYVKVYQCNDSGYAFYYPYNIAGDSKFYEHFQKFDWYYMPWKWEHEITSQYLSDNMKVLEVGCAHGAFIERISEKFNLSEVVGLELNETTVRKSEKWQIKNATIQEYANKCNAKFDIVCSFQVLEHISDVHSFIDSQIKCLKVGGDLIVSVPNNESFIKGKRMALNMPPHHMGLWDSNSLKSLEKYFPLKLHKLHYEFLQDYHIDSYIYSEYYSNCPKTISSLLRRFHKITGTYQKRFEKVKNEKMTIIGHTVLAVYKKV